MHLEYISFHLEHLVLCISPGSEDKVMHDRGQHNFLNLRSDEETDDAHQLELSLGDSMNREDAVEDVDSEEECFRH